jgi:hypothetical protein
MVLKGDIHRMYKNRNIYEFKKSLVVGDEGEIKMKEFLSTLENIEDIKSVQGIKKYQEEDIDFLVKFKNSNNIASIEVKTDTYTSGNLYYETISCIETNTLGCLEKTKADFIFYYFNKFDRLYIFKTNLFREWANKEIDLFNKNPKQSKLSKKQVLNKRGWGENKGVYTSEGYTIPLKYLEEKLANTKIFKRYDSINNYIKKGQAITA